MYGFLYDRGQLGQAPMIRVRDGAQILAPLIPGRAAPRSQAPLPRPVTRAPDVCAKPDGRPWEEWLDQVASGWVTYDTSDPSSITGTAYCPGRLDEVAHGQRFPRDPTNRYFVAFRRAAAAAVACRCCGQCPPGLQPAPGGCPPGFTRATLSVPANGGPARALCSVCLPGEAWYAAGAAQLLCARIPSIYPGAVAPTT
jgi:hypothetical protein